MVCERPPRPRAFRKGNFFVMARPPLLCKEGNPFPIPIHFPFPSISHSSSSSSPPFLTILLTPADQAIQQTNGKVDFTALDIESGRNGDDVLVIPAHIQHEAVLPAIHVQVTLEAGLKNAVRQLPVWCQTIGLAELNAQRKAKTADIAENSGPPPPEHLQLLQEVRPFCFHCFLPVRFGNYPQHLEGDGRAECVGGKRGMGRARRKLRRADQFFSCPQTRKRIQAIRQSLAEDHDIRTHSEVLDAPKLSGPVETHLDLVVHEQDLVFVEYSLQRRKVTFGRNDVTTRALNGLDIERCEFAFTRFRIPHRVVFRLEKPLELLDAIQTTVLGFLLVWTAKAIWKRHEMRTVAEVTVGTAIAIARSDRARAQRAAMIAAHEGKHQVLSGISTDQLERVFDSLRSSDVEVHTARRPKAVFADSGNLGSHFDFFLVQILTGKLRQRVQDRKSTRLNSSHGYISYAVFCLKKKKNIQQSIHSEKDNSIIATKCALYSAPHL